MGLGYFWKKILSRGSAWMRANICEVNGIKLWIGGPGHAPRRLGQGSRVGLGASDRAGGLGLDRNRLYKGLELLVISSTYYLLGLCNC